MAELGVFGVTIDPAYGDRPAQACDVRGQRRAVSRMDRRLLGTRSEIAAELIASMVAGSSCCAAAHCIGRGATDRGVHRAGRGLDLGALKTRATR